MNLDSIHKVFFIGIGGIGMSALARYMHYLKKEVSGYDRVQSPITDSLIREGIRISFEDTIGVVSNDLASKDKVLIVYTPAVKRDENLLLDYFLSNDYLVLKRAELLGVITNNTQCMAVAGTHGKTTTSSILGHILKQSGVSATSFLGGIAENYGSNLILGGTDYSVVEADEFDRSFLQLQPNIACITSVDADHLDIYNSPQDLVSTFRQFAILATDKLIVKKGIPIAATTYGINEGADYDAQNIRIEEAAYVFDVKTPTEKYSNIKLPVAGKHNVLNTMAALAMANSIGVSLQDIAKALLSYRGVHRRFSYRLRTNDWVLIDDYAHHPTEINAVYDTVSELYDTKDVLAVFQPHLFSRTRDFERDFATSLAQFNQVLVLPIYPAREQPIQGVTSENLVAKIAKINPRVSLVKPDELLTQIRHSDKRVVVMMGAGDIGEMVVDIQLELKKDDL